MVRLVTVSDLKQLINKIGIQPFLMQLTDHVEVQYQRWHEFKKMPRPCTHYKQGVIELMPVADEISYAFKYVNGHPENPNADKQTIVAMGLLSEVTHGFPLLISEMTLLTALRTAATSALVSKYLARKDSSTYAMIGTGVQSEFQSLAHLCYFDIKRVQYFDTDPNAMQKYARNMQALGIELVACDSAEQACANADIITVATACKQHVHVIKDAWVKDGMHLNAIGGDCPGKTELEAAILKRTKTVIEYMPQSSYEGEIQIFDDPEKHVYAELWELVNNNKPGRVDANEITLFDSVGFALEDFSALDLVYHLALEHHIGRDIDLIPDVDDPKNLFGVLDKVAAYSSN